LFSSFSSAVLRDFAVMFEALMNENLNSSKIHCDENFLSLIHDFVSSFVLLSDSLFFASFSFAQFVFLSSSDASRSHKRARESLSSALKKRVRSTNDHCDCKLSMKWLEELKKTRCIRSIKSVEHLLSELYYLKRQICKTHINQLKQLYELLSIKNFTKMKEMLWELLKFKERVEIFKIERLDLFETSNDD
jgi:hypothetical protein